MRSVKEIKELAREKFCDAEVLLRSGRPDAAYYVAGYTIELLLKARICKTLQIESFYDFEGTAEKLLSKEAYRPFKVHDLQQLMVLSGIYLDFVKDEQYEDLRGHWSEVTQWKEDSRYSIGQDHDIVREFLESIKKIAQWIEKHL